MVSLSKGCHKRDIGDVISEFCDDDEPKLLFSLKDEKVEVSKKLFLMFSSTIRNLIASLPCCTTASIIIPEYSSSTVKHLKRILESGFTTGVQINSSLKHVFEIIDLAKLFCIDLSDLRNDHMYSSVSNENSKKKAREIEKEAIVKENNVEHAQKSKNINEDELEFLKKKQESLSNEIRSFISLFQRGVEELFCSECSKSVKEDDVVEHYRDHSLEITNKINKISQTEDHDQITNLNVNDEDNGQLAVAELNIDNIESYFDIKNELIETNDETKTQDEFSCPVCNSTFKTRTTLFKHCTIIHCLTELDEFCEVSDDENVCTLCNERFQRKLTLQMHLGIKHMKINDILVKRGFKTIFNNIDGSINIKEIIESKLSCQICKKEKVNMSILWKHYILEHSEVRKQLAKQFAIDLASLECSVCGIHVKSKLRGIIHVGVAHQTLNDVLLGIGLNKLEVPKYAKLSIEKHIKSEEEVPNVDRLVLKHGCQICEFRSDSKFSLRRHYIHGHFNEEMNVIYKEIVTKLTCSLCGHTSKSRHQLMVHIGMKHEYINNILEKKGYEIIIKEKNFKKRNIGRIMYHKRKDLKNQKVRKNLKGEFGAKGKLSLVNIKKMCQICDFTSNFTHNLEKHYITNHFKQEMNQICADVSKDLTCSICDYSSTKKSELRYHIGIIHKYINKMLKDKGYTIIPKIKRKMYKYNHESVGTADISYDVKTEQSNIENETTVLDKILEKISNATERKVITNEEQEALDPINTNEENNLTCKFCPLDFPTEELLDNHATYQHQKKLFFCNQCSKNFTQSGNMRRHQKIHTLNN